MIAQRKDDHVRLAVEQQRAHRGHNEFDDVSFIHHALAGIDRTDISLATCFAGVEWPVPLYINAMTGGSPMTGVINRDLAIAARETGVPIATGSMSPYFKDPSSSDTFSVLRRENPDGFIMANVNATASVEQARQAIRLLQADALQVHLNTIQETVMPEGDRSFASWGPRIGEIVAGVDVPVFVKEVGFGLSRSSVEALGKLGVRVADVGGRGGTNFARIENGRRELADFTYLEGWGQSAPACLLDSQGSSVSLFSSGGVRNPLDIVRSLALGAAAVGASGQFLRTLLDDGVDGLIAQICTWIDHVEALMTALGARTPADLTRCDVLISGALHSFCSNRGIETGQLATRSIASLNTRKTTGDTP
ncbi:type 2 isopentenyl-diphosphate Delta-isomerase [Streptomyces sp. NPDC056534]|uniref:type 2 isopentenyl-diphosphate Delta-isomerase n=1 Tax=Streptomyces sp. NPDC056534 TaxID=3345857 RepID=UPI00368C90DA